MSAETTEAKAGARFSKFCILRERTARGTVTIFQSSRDAKGLRLEIDYQTELPLWRARIYCARLNRAENDADFWLRVSGIGSEVGHYARLVYDGPDSLAEMFADDEKAE